MDSAMVPDSACPRELRVDQPITVRATRPLRPPVRRALVRHPGDQARPAGRQLTVAQPLAVADQGAAIRVGEADIHVLGPLRPAWRQLREPAGESLAAFRAHRVEHLAEGSAALPADPISQPPP